MESSGPYAYRAGPRTTREVMVYDHEAMTLRSTFDALTRAMRYDLCYRTLAQPVLWSPTLLALELRRELDDRYLNEVVW